MLLRVVVLLPVRVLDAVPICFYTTVGRDVEAFVTNWLSDNAHVHEFAQLWEPEAVVPQNWTGCSGRGTSVTEKSPGRLARSSGTAFGGYTRLGRWPDRPTC